MKPNELMIGDWVQITAPGIERTDRVSSIDSIDRSRNVIWVMSLVACISPSYVQPIQLTSEILEASGLCKGRTFVQHSITDHTNTGKRFFPYSLLLGDGRVVITVTFDEDGHRELEIYTPAAHVKMKDCQHVHELQHALSLCGIDIDIKLKKED